MVERGARCAEGDVVHDVDVIADHGRLADDAAGPVVHSDASAPPGSRVDVDAKRVRHLALECERDPPAAAVGLVPPKVGHAGALHRVEPLEEEVDPQEACEGGVGHHSQRLSNDG